jgi:hypothetical protein
MTTYNIHFRPGRNTHGVWYCKPSDNGYNGDVSGETVEEVIAEQVRRMKAYGWVGTIKVLEVEEGHSFGLQRDKVAEVTIVSWEPGETAHDFAVTGEPA